MAAAWAMCAVLGGGCELVLDFSNHTDAGPPDAPPPDNMLVPDPCGVLEPNDTVAQALQLDSGEMRYAAICPGGDLDYYKITMADNETLDFKALFKTSQTTDLDMRLLDSSGTLPIAEARSFDDNEEIKCPSDAGMQPSCSQLAAGDYYVEVFAAVTGEQNVYRLDVSITPN